MKNSFLTTVLFTFIACIMVCSAAAQSVRTSPQEDSISIIPLPTHLQIGNGHFVVNKNTRIVVQPGNADASRIAHMLALKFKKAAALNVEVDVANNPSANTISFTTTGAADSLGNEGYQLSVTNSAATIKAKQSAGLFYGMQTLCQLLPAAIESSTEVKNISWTIPAVDITDVPRFTWRGQHLDVSRHVVSIRFYKKVH